MSNASLRADVPALDELLEAQCPNVRVDLVSHVVIANTPNYAPATTTDKITTMMPMADSFPLSSSSNRCSVTKSSKPTAVPLTTSPVNTSVSTTSPTIVKFVNNTAEELESKMSSGEDGPKRKRARTSPEQLRILQKAFAVDPMPTAASRLTLAAQLGMTPRAVQVWFQNRRAKGKLDGRKEEDGAPVGSSASCSDASPSMPSNTYFAAYRHTLDALHASGTFTSPSSMYAPYYSAYYAASVYDYYKSLSYPPYAAMNLNGVATSASANTASIGHPSSMDNTSAPKLPRPVATSNVSCLTTAVEQNPTTLSLPAGTAPLLSSASSMKNTVVNSFSQPAQFSADMSVSDDSKKGSGTGFYIAPEKCTLSEMLLPRSDLPLSASVSCPAISQHASTVKDSRYQLFGTPLHDATTHRASIDMSSRNFSMSSSEGANTLPFSKSCPDQDLIVAALRASSMTDSAMNVANTSTFDHSLMQPTFELMRKSLENTPSPSPPPASMQICMPMPISYYSEEKMMRSLPETPPASGNFGIAGSFSSTSMDSFTGKAQNRHSSLALAFPQAGKKSGLLNEKNMSSLTYTRSEMNVDCDAKAALCWDRKGKSMKEPYSLYTNWDSNTPPPMMTDMSYRGKGEKQMSPAPETSAFSWYHQGQDLAGKESFYGYPDFEEMAAAQGKKMAGVFDAHGQSGSTDE